MKRLHSFTDSLKQLFLTPVSSGQQWGLIVLIGLVFAFFLPQRPPIDWNLNTEGLWVDGLNMYQQPDRVYPPWALILLIPYYLVRAEGARFFSVIVIGWLVQRRGWSLARFFMIVLGPYFIATLLKSNMDIFVFVLPLLLWESVEDTRWQTLGRGLALSILLLKPQGAVLIWLYLLWTNRGAWREMVKPLLVVAVLVVPISLIGSPPLILQWLDNIRHPSLQNQFFWFINNISLSTYLTPLVALILLGVSFVFLRTAMKWRGIQWCAEHTISGLIMISMFLSPYTSQQSFSSTLAFIPSWQSFLIQVLVLTISFTVLDYGHYIPLWVFAIALASLYFYRSPESASVAREPASAVLEAP